MLISRDAELAGLQQRLLRTGELGAGSVIVSGSRGIGVSSLLDRLVAEHRAAGGVLAQLLDLPDPPTDPLQAAASVAGLAAGRGAVLVVVDDAQWGDVVSLQGLLTAVRHHRRERILVVLGCTADDLGAPRDTADVLARVPARLRLAPLSAAGMQALATAYGVPLHPTLAEALTRFTVGRAGPARALLEELPRGFWSGYDPAFPAPRGVQADVAARMGDLPAGACALVEALAVLGEAPLPVVAALAEQHEPLDDLDTAREAGLVTATDRSGTTYVDLVDPMTAAAVREVLGRKRQAELHRAAADLVEDSVARLTHLAAASPLPDAGLADELEALAAARAGTGEWRSVARLLARAARLTVDPALREDRLARAFDALVGSGDTRGASVAVAEVESLRETPMRNAVLGYLAVVRGRPGEAEQRLERAWDIVNRERDPATAALICQRWVLHSLARVDGESLVAWADRAIELAPPGSPAVIEAKAIRGLGIAASGHGPEALAGYLQLTEEVGHGAQALRVAMARGWLHLALDDVEEARAALASALATDYLGGSTRISLWAHAWLARAQFVAGDWDDALATADQGLVLGERSGMRLIEPLLWWTVAQVSALQGDWARAEEAVRRGDAGPRDYEIMRVPSCLARAAVAEARADYAAVIRALEPLRQPWAGGGIDEPGAWPWPDVYANALVVQGRYDDADAFLVPHEQLAAERDHRSSQARLGYARGRLLGATGQVDAARRHFERAALLLEDLSLPYDRARVHFAWGQSLRRAGKRREADVVLKTACELYGRLGATTYVERCDRELRAGGVHVSRTAPADREVDALTPQEQLVSDLVARGMTNREVANELFVSTKTVQYHLTRIYAKLGIRSRGELAAMRVRNREEPEQT
jgi:DNA-binding CsgD family transcriptional regulator